MYLCIGGGVLTTDHEAASFAHPVFVFQFNAYGTNDSLEEDSLDARPVLAGDTLGGHCEVLDARASRSRPEIGIVRLRAEVSNQRGELVAVCEYINMMRLAAKGADHAHG